MTQKKQRNYLLDLLKVLFCIAAIFPGHFAETLGVQIFGIAPMEFHLAGPLAYGYAFTEGPSILGFKVLSISIFTFLTGYWFVYHFKKTQKTNVFGKGKDVSVLGKFFFSNYSSYWPLAFFGTIYAILFAYISIPGLRLLSRNFINAVVLALPRLIGLKGFGLFSSPAFPMDIASNLSENSLVALTNNFQNQDLWYGLSWNQPLWYMFSIIALLPILYFVFLKSETFALYVMTPAIYIFGNVLMSGASDVYTVVPALGIDFDILRLASPMMLGIWGWYIVDWLKRTEFSKAGQRAYNILSVVSCILMLYTLMAGTGGFHLCDITTASFAIFTLTGKDAFTNGINKGLNKFPLAKHFGMASAGMYLLHYPILQTLAYYATQPDMHPGLMNFLRSLSLNQCAGLFLLFLVALMIPYYFVDKYIIKGLTGLVGKVTKCNVPVVIEETKAEA